MGKQSCILITPTVWARKSIEGAVEVRGRDDEIRAHGSRTRV
jgi:hypothetical protein